MAQGQYYQAGSEPGWETSTTPFWRYAQLVWRATKRVGCASKFCKLYDPEWKLYYTIFDVVCRYDPPGNVDGQYKANLRK